MPQPRVCSISLLSELPKVACKALFPLNVVLQALKLLYVNMIIIKLFFMQCFIQYSSYYSTASELLTAVHKQVLGRTFTSYGACDYDTDHTENAASNSSSTLACVLIAMVMFTEPLPNNSYLFWLHYSGSQALRGDMQTAR